MKEITYYEAFDGTRFDYAYDCITYEQDNKLKSELNNIIIVDAGRIRNPKNWDDLTTLISYIDYVYCKTDEALKLVIESCNGVGLYKTGLDSINTLYKYSDTADCWEDIIKTTNEILFEIKNFKN